MVSVKYFVIVIFKIICITSVFSNATDSKSQKLRRKPRIISGKTSSIEEYPYLVQIDLDFDHQCGGSILFPNVIITAGHCMRKTLSSKRLQVRAGSGFKGRGGSVHFVKNFIQHPNYSLANLSHDIAILKLENPIELDNKTKKAVGLFEPGEEAKHHAKAVTAGWGRITADGPHSDDLQGLELMIVNKKKCSKRWPGMDLKGMLCATSTSDNMKGSTCHGDSGGPLVVGDKLAGVLSFGMEGCTNRPSPEIYTEIAYMRSWIDKTIVKFSKGKSLTTDYNEPINKIDEMKKLIRNLENINVGMSYYWSPHRVAENKMITKLFDNCVIATIEMLKDLFHQDLEDCDEILKLNLEILRKKMYQDWEKIHLQLSTEENILYSIKKKIEPFEEKIRNCLRNNNTSNDNFCVKDNIEAEVSQITDKAEKINLRYLTKTTKNIGTFTVLKNETLVSSLIHENIFLPVNHCMEYA